MFASMKRAIVVALLGLGWGLPGTPVVAESALAAALKDPDKKTREMALAPLLRLGLEDREARAALLGALQGGKPDVRRAILAWLPSSGFRGSEPWASEVTSRLVDLIGRDPARRIRSMAMDALGRVQPMPSTVGPALLKALDDPAEEVVLTAASWLSSSQNSETACVHQMQALRAGATPPLRATAARSLRLLSRCANRAGPALGQALLEEQDVEVRLAVVSVVVNVPAEEEISILIRTLGNDPSPRVRAAACRALPGFDTLSSLGAGAYAKVLAALAAASRDTDEGVRDAADAATRALRAVL